MKVSLLYPEDRCYIEWCMREILFTSCLLLLIAVTCVAFAQEIPTKDVLQVRVSSGSVSFLKTIIMNNETYMLRLCGFKPGSIVKIELSNYSSYGIGRVLYLTFTGKTRIATLLKYVPWSVSLRVPSDALCILVEIARRPPNAMLRPLGNITLRYEVVNSNVTIDSEVVPDTAVIGDHIARLSHVDVCLLSLAPVKILLDTKQYVALIRNDTVILNGYLLYRQCLRSYSFPLRFKVIGAATVQVTAYYGVPLSTHRKSETVTVRLSPEEAKTCTNVRLCNSTYCGPSVRVKLGGYLIVSVSGIALTRLRLDSAFSKILTLTLPGLVPSEDIKLVDEDGHILNKTDIDVVLRGLITTSLTRGTCIPRGTYMIIMRLYNKTYSIGRESIGEGTLIQLPVRMYLVKFAGKMNIRRVVFFVKDLKIVNPRVILLPPDTSPRDLKVLIITSMGSVETWFNVVNNTIIVDSCIARVKFYADDYLGFSLDNAEIVLTHGEYRYVCTAATPCLLPCGNYVVQVQLGSKTLYMGEIEIGPRTRQVTLRLQLLSSRSVELLTYVAAIAGVVVIVAGVSRFSRRSRGEDEAEIIEIQ